MISPDLVLANRRGEVLKLSRLAPADLDEARRFAEELLTLAQERVDACHEEVDAALTAVDRSAKHEKMFQGLKKLVLDACHFDAPLELSPGELRLALFERAAQVRLEQEEFGPLARSAVLEEVAARLGLSAAQLEQGLFSDLKGAERLIKAPSMSVEELLENYQLAQLQGVLLRAVRVELTLEKAAPEVLRQLIRRLKFRNLLFSAHQLETGAVRIEIDGPFSLFDSVTKYGLKLAQLVPVLWGVPGLCLEAELRWGKDRKALRFRHEMAGATESTEDEPRSEVVALLESLARYLPRFAARTTSRLFTLPGVGVVVPDLVIRREDGREVFVEVLGYWSRDAVFRRVEWSLAAGRDSALQDARFIFALSSRLRVSEALLTGEENACLYVYKGAMQAKALIAHVETLLGPGSP